MHNTCGADNVELFIAGYFSLSIMGCFFEFSASHGEKEDKKPPVPTRYLTIYFKDVPSRVIGLEPGGIFSELI